MTSASSDNCQVRTDTQEEGQDEDEGRDHKDSAASGGCLTTATYFQKLQSKEELPYSSQRERGLKTS